MRCRQAIGHVGNIQGQNAGRSAGHGAAAGIILSQLQKTFWFAGRAPAAGNSGLGAHFTLLIETNP